VGSEAARNEIHKTSKATNHAHHIAVCRPTRDSRIVVDLYKHHTVQEGQVDPSSYEIEEEAGNIAHVLVSGGPSPLSREMAFGNGIVNEGESSIHRWATET
jgi:hypothetical protein